MNLALERQKLIDELTHVNDIHLLKAIKELLAYAKISKESKALEPFTEEEFMARIDKAEEDIKHGRVTSLKDIRKEIKNW